QTSPRIPRHTLYTTIICFPQTAPSNPETSTLSLHDALPISAAIVGATRKGVEHERHQDGGPGSVAWRLSSRSGPPSWWRSCSTRSEEHTSELQSRGHLVCRLLLEKKNDEVFVLLTYSRGGTF